LQRYISLESVRHALGLGLILTNYSQTPQEFFSTILANFSFCLLLHLLLHFPPFLMSGRRWKFIHFPAKHKKHKRHHLELLFEKSFASTFMRATESQNRIIKGEMEKEVFHWWLKSVKYK